MTKLDEQSRTDQAGLPFSPPTERTHVSDYKGALLRVVLDNGYTHFDQPIQLASGEWSHDFIDGKRALARGADLQLACQAILQVASELDVDFDAVGGLTLGADQFAHGVALVGDKRWFVIRKQPKGRGTNKLIEGTTLTKGVRVLLVDDVVSSGGSIQQAYQNVCEAGAAVVLATTLVDRGDVATRFFERKDVTYRPLLDYRDMDIPAVGGGASPLTSTR